MPIYVNGKELKEEDMFVADILNGLYGAATEKVLMNEIDKALATKPVANQAQKPFGDSKPKPVTLDAINEAILEARLEIMDWELTLEQLLEQKEVIQQNQDKLRADLDKDLKAIQEKYAGLGLEFQYKI